MEMLDHALSYANRGWPVFPIQPGTKKPYQGSRGFLDAATNEILVTRMWDDHGDADIAFATGKAAGVWVLDVDGEEGSRSLTVLESELGPLPETLEARTGSGGRHLFFRWPAARDVRNKQPIEYAGTKRIGVDVRGEGGYIILPPSSHPSGGHYAWPYGMDTPVAEIPVIWLDAIAPVKRRPAPWERQYHAPAPTAKTAANSPVIDRAIKYLAECEPAIQGSGGHNALLWAARAMVIGFGLDDATAIGLLWSEFNPRCSPPWDSSSSAERRDFERKVQQARETPGEKPAGWLLDEYGLRGGDDAMASIVGNRSANAILAKHSTGAETVQEVVASEGLIQYGASRYPFPVDLFPPRLADYCRQVSEAHVVDESFVALPMLAAAGAAMGNPWRLKAKKGFVVPPVLWVGLVAPSGSNKSGPLSEVLSPLYKEVPIKEIRDAMLNPQGRLVVSDATLEAVVALLNNNHKGLLVFRDELAGWANGFNSYKKGAGSDEQSWIEFWGAKRYNLDRKTNNEQVCIHAAAVSILGGIQPTILAQCFDPGKFASGLVPRILVTCPEPKDMYWTEAEVADDATEVWAQTILWLRTRPFVSLDPNSGQYMPRILEMSAEAKAEYVPFFNEMTRLQAALSNDHAHSFVAKARVQAARMILIHRGLALAEAKSDHLDAPVGVESARAGVAWGRWCLNEQMRIYGFASDEYLRERANYLADAIRAKCPGGEATVRDVIRVNNKRFPDADSALSAMHALVSLGLARWVSPRKKVILI